MTWNAEMAEAYQTGLKDGLAGHRRGRPNDFEACYEQGYQHGRDKAYSQAAKAYTRARANMAECLAD
jgi:flagellar biosynthesis/type III secretory pathway protein FliH